MALEKPGLSTKIRCFGWLIGGFALDVRLEFRGRLAVTWRAVARGNGGHHNKRSRILAQLVFGLGVGLGLRSWG